MDDQRSIRLGPRTWGTPPPREWPWTTSRAGNPMTRHNGRTAVIKEIHLSVSQVLRRRNSASVYKWTLSPIDNDPNGKWVWSDESYETMEEAKHGALIALGVRKRREPVPTDDAPTPSAPSAGPERRIVVD